MVPAVSLDTMRKSKSNVATTKLLWWLDQGDEQCPHCGQLYFAEAEIRCADCDGPMCSLCKVRQTEGHIVCPDCVRQGAHG
jgi:hypothetical protein